VTKLPGTPSDRSDEGLPGTPSDKGVTKEWRGSDEGVPNNIMVISIVPLGGGWRAKFTQNLWAPNLPDPTQNLWAPDLPDPTRDKNSIWTSLGRLYDHRLGLSD